MFFRILIPRYFAVVAVCTSHLLISTIYYRFFYIVAVLESVHASPRYLEPFEQSGPCRSKKFINVDQTVPSRNYDRKIRATKLQNPTIDAQFCHTMSQYADNILLEEPSQVQTISISKSCNLSSLTVVKTQLNQINIEENIYMKQISIIFSPLQEVPRTLSMLSNLIEAKFNFCDIKDVDLHQFCSLAYLKELKLSLNKITSVRGTLDVVCQSPLKHIQLDVNFLTDINLDVFAPFLRLLTLDLSSNKIESVRGSPSNPELQLLYLTNNQLTVLDMCKWTKPNNMLDVIVTHNKLSRVPLCLEKLDHVSFVNLRQNEITKVGLEVFNKLPKLECINLSYNNITTIPLNESMYPPMLKHLEVHDNPLDFVTIPNGTFERLTINLQKDTILFA